MFLKRTQDETSEFSHVATRDDTPQGVVCRARVHEMCCSMWVDVSCLIKRECPPRVKRIEVLEHSKSLQALHISGVFLTRCVHHVDTTVVVSLAARSIASIMLRLIFGVCWLSVFSVAQYSARFKSYMAPIHTE